MHGIQRYPIQAEETATHIQMVNDSAVHSVKERHGRGSLTTRP